MVRDRPVTRRTFLRGKFISNKKGYYENFVLLDSMEKIQILKKKTAKFGRL